MLPQLSQILGWLGQYGYIPLLLFSIIEGPIVTVIAGFLSSTNHYSFLIAYCVVVTGDLLGDSIIYTMGRHYSKGNIPFWLRWVGVTKDRVEIVSKNFDEHPKKIFFTGKITHGGGFAVLFGAGVVKFPFIRFLFYNFLFTIVKSGILIVIGFYFGKAYIHIQHYIDYVAVSVGIIFILFYITFLYLTKDRSLPKI